MAPGSGAVRPLECPSQGRRLANLRKRPSRVENARARRPVPGLATPPAAQTASGSAGTCCGATRRHRTRASRSASGATHIRTGAQRREKHTQRTRPATAEILAQRDGNPARPAPNLAAADLASAKNQRSQPVVRASYRSDNPHLLQAPAVHATGAANHRRTWPAAPAAVRVRTAAASHRGLRSSLERLRSAPRPAKTSGTAIQRQRPSVPGKSSL